MMKSLKTWIFLLFGLSLMAFVSHDFHTSTTRVEYNSSLTSIKLTAKFFTDDLEKAVGKSISNKASFESSLKGYLKNHFSMKVNGKPSNITFVGVQTTDKNTRIYLEVNNIKSVESIELNNTMLTDKFSDQQNLINFDVNGVTKSLMCHKANPSGVVNF